MFEKIDVYPYRRVGRDGSRQKKQKRHSGNDIKSGRIIRKLFRLKKETGQVLTWSGVVLAVAGFFLGRAVLLGELVPFATAIAVGAARVFPGSLFFTLLGVAAGLATIKTGLALVGSVITVTAVGLLARALPEDLKRPWLVLPGLVFSVTLIVRTAFLAVASPSLYDFISASFEAVLAAVLTVTFVYGLPTFRRIKGLQSLSGEEFFCVLTLLAGVVAGTGDLALWPITLKGLFSRVIILLFALMGGVGLGAAAGAVVGIIPGLSYVLVPAMVGAYSFAGLLAGMCRSFGKLGVALGFLLGNVLLSVYINNYGNLTEVLAETALAIGLFLLVPYSQIQKLTSSLAPVVPQVQQSEPREARVKEVVAGRVRNWSRVFQELSRTFEQVSAATQENKTEPAMQSLLDEIGVKVCTGCALYRTCWERDFYKTYQNLLDLFSLVEIYGKISGGDLPEDLKRRCSRPNELAITVTCLYETFKLNNYWAKRLSESREIVSEQLKGVSDIMENLSTELELEIDSAGEADNSLKQRLKQHDIPATEVRWVKQEDGSDEVVITRQACSGDVDCLNRVAPLVSKAVGQPYRMACAVCTRPDVKEMCTFRLYPRLKYKVSVGVARVGKNGSTVSGDSYSLLELRGGKFALILSDGMGCGSQAALESNTTLSLLENLLRSGFGRDLAIKTLNSMMMLRSPDDSFATVDMAVLDLYNGEAEFIKIAASPSFLMRGRRISMIRTNSLPVGIVKDIDVSTVTRSLVPGDVLVMVTDGVLDAYRGPGEKEDWVVGVLEEVSDFEPQELADLLLKLAQTGAGGANQIPDDMAVLVARLDAF